MSQKLNEKLELVQKARLGLGYDSEAAVLNRCATYSRTATLDSRGKLTRDTRADLAVVEFRLQEARSQTSPGGAKPSTSLDHEEPDGQKAHHSVSARLSYVASGPT